MAAEWTKQFLPEENGNENDWGGGGGNKNLQLGFWLFANTTLGGISRGCLGIWDARISYYVLISSAAQFVP